MRARGARTVLAAALVGALTSCATEGSAPRSAAATAGTTQVPDKDHRSPAPDSRPAPSAPKSPAATPKIPAAAPVRVDIPAIGVDGPVVPLGLQADGALAVPSEPGDAGWWMGGSAPGDPGPAVIVAHRDSVKGPALFYGVPALEKGDEIRVEDAEGTSSVFVVDRVELHDKDQFPTNAVYGPTRRPTLRLLTCGGNYDAGSGYAANYVVFAEQKG